MYGVLNTDGDEKAQALTEERGINLVEPQAGWISLL